MAWDLVTNIKGATGATGEAGETGATGATGAAGADGDAADIAAEIYGATAKTTPVDADTIGITDSAASNVLKKLSWANIKATIGAWYDAATRTLTNKDLTSGTNTFPTLNQNTTGSAATLTTGRTIRTNLASTSAPSFNGSANITPGVNGTLPVANGGSGRATATTPYGVIAAGTTATGAQQTISPGTAGQFLKSAGGSALPAMAAITQADVANLVTDLGKKSNGISIEGYGNAETTTYVKLGTLPIDDTSNKSNFLITGRLGGWVHDNQSFVSITLTNRSGAVDGNTVSAAVSVLGNNTNASAIVDIVVYKQADLSSIVYLKLDGYYAYALNVTEIYGAAVAHTGGGESTVGSEIWSLWDAPRFEVNQAGAALGYATPTAANHLTRKDYVDSATSAPVDRRQVNGSIFSIPRTAVYGLYGNIDTEYMHVVYLYPGSDMTIDTIDIPIKTGATATVTVCQIGVYEVAENGDLTLIGSTANDATLFNTSNSNATKALSAPVNLVGGTTYAFGLLHVTSGTEANFWGMDVEGFAAELTPRISGYYGSSTTTLPAEIDWWNVYKDTCAVYMRGYEA